MDLSRSHLFLSSSGDTSDDETAVVVFSGDVGPSFTAEWAGLVEEVQC